MKSAEQPALPVFAAAHTGKLETSVIGNERASVTAQEI